MSRILTLSNRLIRNRAALFSLFWERFRTVVFPRKEVNKCQERELFSDKECIRIKSSRAFI